MPEAKKVEEPEGPHPQQKYLHVIVLSLSLIQFIFLVCLVVDGHAVAQLKEAPPPLFSGNNYTLRDIVRYPYGLGCAYDQYHMWWYRFGGSDEGQPGNKRNLREEIDYVASFGNGAYIQDGTAFDRVLTTMQKDNVPHNFAAYFDCGHLSQLGRGVQAFVYIGLIVVAFQIISSAINNAELFDTKGISLGLQLLAFISFLIITIGIAAIYNKEWVCHNAYIRKIIVMEHFDINYGVAFAVVGMVISPINSLLIALWHEGQSQSGEKDNAPDTQQFDGVE